MNRGSSLLGRPTRYTVVVLLPSSSIFSRFQNIARTRLVKSAKSPKYPLPRRYTVSPSCANTTGEFSGGRGWNGDTNPRLAAVYRTMYNQIIRFIFAHFFDILLHLLYRFILGGLFFVILKLSDLVKLDIF